MSQTETLFPISEIAPDYRSPKCSIVTLNTRGRIKKVEVVSSLIPNPDKLGQYSVRIKKVPIAGTRAFFVQPEIIINP